MMDPKGDRLFSNAYESFIDKHLKTYGYFSKSQTELDDERETLKDYEYNFENLWGKNSSQALVKSKSRMLFEEGGRLPSEGEVYRTYQSTLQKPTGKTGMKRRNYFTLKTAEESIYPSSSVRWPVEMQVIPQRIKHIDYKPYTPESLSSTVLGEVAPYRPHLDEGKVVFSYPVVCGKKFSKSYNGSRISFPSDLRKKYPNNSLIFESRFESGNLAKAVQIDKTTYELHLRPDLYSESQAQWFYFRVQNMQRGVNYKFSIVNLHKIAGLYDFGMKPLMYSDRMANSLNLGWHRVGDHVTYCKNDYDPVTGNKPTQLHTLSWTFQFPCDNDTVYFAQSFPYTYSDLQEYLTDLMQHPIRSQWCTVETLCRTLAGNQVYLVTIFSPVETPQKKRAIVITARVHPGETPGSWVMKGLIDFLTGDSSVAQTLREKFVFKLVPMLNPDGVIAGNNRYSLSGRDLNRTYRTLLKEVFPPTWHLRRLVRKLLEDYNVSLYCDLHGHSRKPNVFVYGCENGIDSPNYLREQVFPLLLSQHSPDMFSFGQCKFHMHKQREGTGRVVMWLMGVVNSYTLEVSFAGSTVGLRRGTHFSAHDYMKIAVHLCNAIAEYFDDSKMKFFENQLAWRKSMLEQLVENGSTATEPVAPKRMHALQDSETSAESILTEDQVEDIVRTKSDLEQKIVAESFRAVVSETKRKKKKKKRKRSVKSMNERDSIAAAAPNRVATARSRSTLSVRKIVSSPIKRQKEESTATNAWQKYQKLFEPENQGKISTTYYSLRAGDPRRTRLRSLLNLNRNILAQTMIIRENSPLHKKLTKDILKETQALTESLSKELQMLSDAEKRSRKNQIMDDKNKTRKKRPIPPLPRSTISSGLKPKVVIPFHLSVKTTVPCLTSKYKGVMVP